MVAIVRNLKYATYLELFHASLFKVFYVLIPSFDVFSENLQKYN